MAGAIVDHLRIDMLHAAEYGQPGTFRRTADPLPDPLMDPHADIVLRSLFHLLASGSRFADLLAQHFASVPDSLVLIWVGRTQGANISRHLSDQLLVVAAQDQMRLLIDFQ